MPSRSRRWPGRTLRVIIAGGHHADLFDAVVSAADRYLADHYPELRELFEAESPGWVPDAVYRRVFDRLFTRLRHRLAAMAADPDDEARHQFDEWIAGLPDRLETSPELRERGERLKREVFGSAGLRDWSSSLWQKAKEALRAQAADPQSELRRRLADALEAAASAPGQTAVSSRASSAWSSREQGHSPISSTTISPALSPEPSKGGMRPRPRASWNCSSGAICHFIRINGTVVGAGVGLALHAIALALA